MYCHLPATRGAPPAIHLPPSPLRLCATLCVPVLVPYSCDNPSAPNEPCRVLASTVLTQIYQERLRKLPYRAPWNVCPCRLAPYSIQDSIRMCGHLLGPIAGKQRHSLSFQSDHIVWYFWMTGHPARRTAYRAFRRRRAGPVPSNKRGRLCIMHTSQSCRNLKAPPCDVNRCLLGPALLINLRGRPQVMYRLGHDQKQMRIRRKEAYYALTATFRLCE